MQKTQKKEYFWDIRLFEQGSVARFNDTLATP